MATGAPVRVVSSRSRIMPPASAVMIARMQKPTASKLRSRATFPPRIPLRSTPMRSMARKASGSELFSASSRCMAVRKSR